MNPDRFVPQNIRLEFANDQANFLHYYTRLNCWTPFEAACLLRGLIPVKFDPETGCAIAIWPLDPVTPEDSLEHFEGAEACCLDLSRLTRVIATNMCSSAELAVVPDKIVSWALDTLTIPRDCDLARAFERRRLAAVGHAADPASSVSDDGSLILELQERCRQLGDQVATLERENSQLQTKAKGTGKQWAEVRERVYAAALHRLASDLAQHTSSPSAKDFVLDWANQDHSCIDRSGRVVAAKLAAEVDDSREFYGFPSGDKNPAATAIEGYLAKSLGDEHWAGHWAKKTLGAI